jgi:hypothetical protein
MKSPLRLSHRNLSPVANNTLHLSQRLRVASYHACWAGSAVPKRQRRHRRRHLALMAMTVYAAIAAMNAAIAATVRKMLPPHVSHAVIRRRQIHRNRVPSSSPGTVVNAMRPNRVSRSKLRCRRPRPSVSPSRQQLKIIQDGRNASPIHRSSRRANVNSQPRAQRRTSVLSLHR